MPPPLPPPPQDSLKQAEKDAQLYNSRESLMGLPITDYSRIKKVIEGFEPFFQFWTTAASWRKQHQVGGRLVFSFSF